MDRYRERERERERDNSIYMAFKKNGKLATCRAPILRIFFVLRVYEFKLVPGSNKVGSINRLFS